MQEILQIHLPTLIKSPAGPDPVFGNDCTIWCTSSYFCITKRCVKMFCYSVSLQPSQIIVEEDMQLLFFFFFSMSLILIKAPSFSAGGSFPHSVRSCRSLPSRRRTDQASESCSVHAWGRPAEDPPTAWPPQLVTIILPHTHSHSHTAALLNSPTTTAGCRRTSTHLSVSWSLQTHFRCRFRSPLTKDKKSRAALTRFLWVCLYTLNHSLCYQVTVVGFTARERFGKCDCRC